MNDVESMTSAYCLQGQKRLPQGKILEWVTRRSSHSSLPDGPWRQDFRSCVSGRSDIDLSKDLGAEVDLCQNINESRGGNAKCILGFCLHFAKVLRSISAFHAKLLQSALSSAWNTSYYGGAVIVTQPETRLEVASVPQLPMDNLYAYLSTLFTSMSRAVADDGVLVRQLRSKGSFVDCRTFEWTILSTDEY